MKKDEGEQRSEEIRLHALSFEAQDKKDKRGALLWEKNRITCFLRPDHHELWQPVASLFFRPDVLMPLVVTWVLNTKWK